MSFLPVSHGSFNKIDTIHILIVGFSCRNLTYFTINDINDGYFIYDVKESEWGKVLLSDVLKCMTGFIGMGAKEINKVIADIGFFDFIIIEDNIKLMSEGCLHMRCE
jgi:hypothetical protein